MPKTGILYHDGKYIQVSGVFGNTSRETKILPWESAIDKNNLEKLFEHMARIFNAGYTPSNDSIGFVKNKRGGEFIVHDFDYFARVEYQDTEEKKKDMMKLNLKYLLNQLQVNSGIKKQEAVQRLLEKVQHPEMQQLLKELQTEQL